MLSRLLNQSLVYLGASVANAAVPFLLLPVLTRVLSPADYGMVAMFTITVSILGAFTGLNVSSALTVRYVQLDAERVPEYLNGCLRVLAMSSLGVAVLVVLLGPWLTQLTQLPVGWLLAAALTAAAQVVINIRATLWQMQSLPIRYAALQVSQGLVNAGLSVLLVLVVGLAWQGRVLGQVLATLGCMLVAASLLKRSVSRAWRGEDVRDALRFGVPLIPHVIGGLTMAAADRMLISNLLDVAQVGIYAVGLQIGMVISLLAESCNKAYVPWLMRSLSTSGALSKVRMVRLTYLYFVALVLLALTVGLAAPHVLKLLVGEQFRAASAVVGYIAMGYAFCGMYYMVANYIFFAGRTTQLAIITLTAGIFSVAITWILIRRNGLVGAAQGFMLAQAYLFLAAWWLSHRARPMPWMASLSRTPLAL